MSVGFGFSVGDFISALQLVGTVINALRESGDSSTEYQALISQLYTLETALLRVKRLELDDTQHAEVIALRQAASQCQRTIDAFWEKIKKYQPSLRAGGSGSRIKDGWKKVKWALCKKEDLVRFKMELMAHTESIDILLTTGAVRIDNKKNEDNQRTLASKVQDSYFSCMQRMTTMLDLALTGIQQGKQLIDMTAKAIQTNVQIFQMVLRIHSIVTSIPGQVERQQPVYLIDALGRHTPFYLEFITSAESLTFVLQNNFKNIGSGASKIKRGEFAIQDSASKRDINLASAWETCFRPGQNVAMSMVFNSADASNMYCPECREDNGDDFAEDEDIECRNCKMEYRRSISWTSSQPLPSFSMRTAQVLPSVPIQPEQTLSPFDPSSTTLKGKRVFDEDEEMTLFRRVRIKTSIILLAKDSRPGPPLTAPQLAQPRAIGPSVITKSKVASLTTSSQKNIPQSTGPRPVLPHPAVSFSTRPRGMSGQSMQSQNVLQPPTSANKDDASSQDTFMGSADSHSQREPLTPLELLTPYGLSFSVPTVTLDLYLVARNLHNISQSIEGNFQPDQLFP